jgi:hypothetical protein
MDFSTALCNFITRINQDTEKHAQKFENMKWGEYFKPVEIKRGQKNVKVIQLNGSSRSAYCFVEIATGDIFMAAGWNAPAKGARGNIYQLDKLAGADMSGTEWLYRR